MGLPSFPIKILGKSVKGFLSYDEGINKQTDKQRLQLFYIKDNYYFWYYDYHCY